MLDLSDDLAGSYCTKLLADAGAEVLKVEPPSGHLLRHWSRTGSLGRDGDPDGVLFRFLAAGQRSVVADLDDSAGRHRVREWLAASDIAVTSSPAEQLDARGLCFADVHRVNHELTVVSLTPFGLTGPRNGQSANDFLLQALSGSLHNHGNWRREPLAVGGGLGEWIAGAYGAAGALAARARLHRTGGGELVDVSTLEALAVTLVCYPSVAASAPGGVRRRATVEMVPGIEPCKDGFVGLTTLTAQQWHDFLAMIDRPDLIGERAARQHPRPRRPRGGVAPGHRRLDRAPPRCRDHRTGSHVPRSCGTGPQWRDPVPFRATRRSWPLHPQPPRWVFDPRPPFLSTATEPRPVAAAPRVGEHAVTPFRSTRTTSPQARTDEDGCLPLEGVRVLDVTAFWAGPAATQYLATLGADVIKVESVQRPDSMRFNVSVSPKTEGWWEQGYLFLSANLNKRGITLNLGDDRGRELFLQLASQSDVVVENFTPRRHGEFQAHL